MVIFVILLNMAHSFDSLTTFYMTDNLLFPPTTLANFSTFWTFCYILGLLLFYEYLLAHKISPPPKLPNPKNINNAESLLVLLGELYPKDQLLEWLGQVPLYDGNNLYILAMGTFSILGGLSENIQSKNERLVQRCLQRIY